MLMELVSADVIASARPQCWRGLQISFGNALPIDSMGSGLVALNLQSANSLAVVRVGRPVMLSGCYESSDYR